MKYDLNLELKSLDDDPLHLGDEQKTPLTLNACLTMALRYTDPQKETNGEKQYKNYELLKKLIKEDSPDFKVEEVSRLKEVVRDYPFVTEVKGIVLDMLEEPVK